MLILEARRRIGVWDKHGGLAGVGQASQLVVKDSSQLNKHEFCAPSMPPHNKLGVF